MAEPKTKGLAFPYPILMNSVYLNLLYSLTEKKINYCLLRNRPEKEAKLKDLDLLVHPANYGCFTELCQKNGFFKLRSKRLNPYKSVWVAHLKQHFWTLDVHTEMVSRGLIYMDRDKVLERKKKLEGYYRVTDEDLLVSLIFHNLIGKRSISKIQIAEISNLLSSNIDYSYIYEHIRKYGLWEVFEDFLKNFAEIQKGQMDSTSLKKRTIQSLKFRPKSNLVRHLWILFSSWVNSTRSVNKGLSIAFIGPDGMGKSSLVGCVKDYYSDFIYGASSAYLGPWGKYRLHLWRYAKKFHLSPNPDANIPFWSLKYFKYFTRSTLYYLLLACELWYRYFKDVLPHLRKGKILVIDRYIYDILVGHRNKEIKHFAWFRSFLCKSFPPPDMLFLLDCEPELVLQRKNGKISLEELEYLRRAYDSVVRDLQKKNRFHVQILRVDGSVVEARDQIVNLIWQKLEHRSLV